MYKITSETKYKVIDEKTYETAGEFYDEASAMTLAFGLNTKHHKELEKENKELKDALHVAQSTSL